MKIDLHCHSNCSDGQYSFTDLLQKAHSLSINSLAITDHDTIQGYLDLKAQSTHASDQFFNLENRTWHDHTSHTQRQPSSEQPSLKLFTGLEISTTWSGLDIHIVGLDFDPKNNDLSQMLMLQNQKRADRAKNIAKKLDKQGIFGSLQGAKSIAQSANVARPHFAQYLVDQGKVKNIKQAFDRYLAQGKPCYQPTQWPNIAEAISLIKSAGGIAVMAHPTRYRITATKLRQLVKDFAEYGGQAIEFIGGSNHKDSEKFLTELCQTHRLWASPASDFHTDKQIWQRLGQTGTVPKIITGVWEHFGEPFAYIN